MCTLLQGSSSSTLRAYSYSVKVVNPNKKADYKVHKLRNTSKVFTSVIQLKAQLMESLEEHVPTNIGFSIGYIEPSRQGVRGKQHWIFNSDDLDDMYEAYNSAHKSEIMIWCDGVDATKANRKKRPSPTSDDDDSAPRKKSSCSDSISKKLEEVDSIYDELESKHRSSYSKEQLRMWARMVQMQKWSSYENPPNKPFFKSASTATRKESPEKSSNAGNAMGISPVRRSNLRSQYMNQVDQWHKLLEARAISQEEYDEHKSAILNDMKKL